MKQTDLVSWHRFTVNDMSCGKCEADFLLLPCGFLLIS